VVAYAMFEFMRLGVGGLGRRGRKGKGRSALAFNFF
jgi:hypothetical protein